MKKVFGLIFTVLLFFVTSCEDDEVSPDFGIIANAGDDREVFAGEEVILDGTGTVDESGEGFQADWSFVTTPEGSEAVIVDAASITARFTPDIEGEYSIRLTVENDYGSDSDEINILAIDASDMATIFELAENTEGFSILTEAVLRFPELVAFLSDENLSLTLMAPNDEAFEDLFAASAYNSLDDIPDNILLDILLYHVIGETILRASDIAGGSVLKPMLEGAEIIVTVDGEEIFLNNNALISSADIHAVNGIVHVINAVLLPPLKISGDFSEDLVLSAPFEYFVTSRMRILNQSTLTIAPGTRLSFAEDASLIVQDGSIISAEGTAEDQILLTATEETPGWWRGVQIRETQSTANILDHVIIEYGGGGTYWSTQSRTANLVVGGRISSEAARVTVSNSIFRHSADAGIYVRDPSELPASVNNNYTGNKISGIIPATGIEYFDGSSAYTGNETDGIVIYSGDYNVRNVTWKNSGVPYIVNDRIRISEIELTIEAGTEFAFNNDTYFQVRDGAIIRAHGEQGNPVMFTATENTPGWWRGFNIQGSMSTQNVLDHVIIEYAGGNGFWSTHNTYANLVIGGRIASEAARLRVTNSVFRNSEEHGLHLTSSSEMPASSGNIYTDNMRAPVFMGQSGMHFMDGGSSFTGNNGNDHILVVRQGETSGNITWNKLDVPYRAREELRIFETELTIEAGAVFEFENGAGLAFRDNTVISIEGTSDDPVLFTGSEKVEGWWKGLLLSNTPSSQNTIDNVIIEYGGGGSYWSTHNQLANLVIGGRTGSDAARVSVTNSIFRNSGDYGIVISAESDVNDDLCTENVFEGNQGGNCFFR